MNLLATNLTFILAALINVVTCQYYNRPFYFPYYDREYTTQVYDRHAFYCFSCTNNRDIASNRGRFRDATDDCGFSNDFRAGSRHVKKELCFTYCMKKEVGTYGGVIDVERRCEPNCQEYNGNTRIRYLIDRVSCCQGDMCNGQIRASACFYAIFSFVLVSFSLGKI